MTRNFALRERGFASTSSSEGIVGFLVIALALSASTNERKSCYLTVLDAMKADDRNSTSGT